MAHDVFISHAAHEKQFADRICAKLESRGIRCWIAPRDIRPGMSWGSAIIEAIDGARVMLLVFSSHANESPQVSREVERAVSKGVVIVPVRVEDVKPSGDLEYFLGTPHWLDAITPPFAQHLDRIVDSTKFWLERTKGGVRTHEAPLPTPPTRAETAARAPTATLRTRTRPNWTVPAFVALVIALVGSAAFLSNRALQAPAPDPAAEQSSAAANASPASQPVVAPENSRPAVDTRNSGQGSENGPSASPTGPLIAEASVAAAIPTPGETTPPSGFCTMHSPTIGTQPVAGPQVPTKPCGSDVAQCLSDMDSCLSRARHLDAESAAQLGYVYMNGLGVGRNYDLARNWSYLAATKGNALGQDTMGELYKIGEGGLSQDYKQAQEYFAKAAAQDCPLAENDLGDLNLYGKGVERNPSEALKWYKKAAEHDDAMGQNNLGFMYIRGFGVNKDSSAALDWYLKSAKQGSPFAQDALGYMYQTGLGVGEDPAQALQCYKTAAEQGFATAQIHLAELYKKGIGAVQNSTEAARWYCKALALGNIEAKAQLQSMGADCSSLPAANTDSPALNIAPSQAAGAASTPATSAQSP